MWAHIHHRLLTAFCVGWFAVTAAAHAQTPPIPIESEAELTLKVLAYDRNLPTRGKDRLVITVLHRAIHRDGRARADGYALELEAQGPTGPTDVPVEVLRMAWTDVDTLRDEMVARNSRVLWVAPGLERYAPELAALGDKEDILVFQDGDRELALGLGVGFRQEGDRTRIVVQLEASRKQGADFDAQLLRMAEVR